MTKYDERTKDRFSPKRAGDYFEQMRQQYELLLEDTKRDRSKLIEDLVAKVAQSPAQATWAEVFTLESAFFYALPADRVAAEVVLLRERYHGVSGNEKYNDYVQAVEADVDKLTPARQRAELFALAERLHYLYTFVPPKELIRNQLAQNAAWLTVGIFIIAQVASVSVLIAQQIMPTMKIPNPTILIVIFSGALGGFLSVQQRLQAADNVDPLFKELQLRAGWFSVVVLGPLSGAVFACVLYWLFLAKLLTGGLFPEFQPELGNGSPFGWAEFVAQSAPINTPSYGKLLVWAFIAGFAERFVPNVLTRLAGQSTTAESRSSRTSKLIGGGASRDIETE